MKFDFNTVDGRNPKQPPGIYIYIYINFVNNRIKLINYQPPRDLAGFLNHQQSGDHGKPMPLRPRQSSAVALVTAASYAGAGFYGQHLVEIVELLCPMRNIYMYYIISTYIYIYMHTIYIHYTYIYIYYIYIYIYAYIHLNGVFSLCLVLRVWSTAVVWEVSFSWAEKSVAGS